MSQLPGENIKMKPNRRDLMYSKRKFNKHFEGLSKKYPSYKKKYNQLTNIKYNLYRKGVADGKKYALTFFIDKDFLTENYHYIRLLYEFNSSLCKFPELSYRRLCDFVDFLSKCLDNKDVALEPDFIEAFCPSDLFIPSDKKNQFGTSKKCFELVYRLGYCNGYCFYIRQVGKTLTRFLVPHVLSDCFSLDTTYTMYDRNKIIKDELRRFNAGIYSYYNKECSARYCQLRRPVIKR